MRITDKFHTHHKRSTRVRLDKPIHYKHATGRVNVVYMSRYRNVEFVFGLLDKSHKDHKKEACLFEVRHKDWKNNNWFLLDKSELNTMAEGFKKLNDIIRGIL